MKVYLRKGSFLLTIFLALIMILSCFGLSACNPELPEIPVTSGKLTNESGFVVEGGDFGEGATLSASAIDEESEDYSQVITAIEGQNYDKTQPVYVFEVSVEKDGVKVQPNGKVKVTIPVSGDLTDYDVLHVKSDGSVERLSVTYENGMASFETDSFSKFVFVKKAAPIIDDNSGNQGDNDNKGDDNKGDNTPAATCTFSASVEEYAGVDNIGKITENGNEVDFGEGREVAKGSEITLSAEAKSGYALKGWYKVEGANKTLLSCAKTYTFTVDGDTNIKAVFDEKVTVGIEAQGLMLGGGSSLGQLIIRIKGVEQVKYSSFSMDVAKGTEVTIEMIPCSGTAFKDWSYRYPDDSDSSLQTISTNAQYTFVAEKNIYFYAWGNGIPKELTFTYNSKVAMENRKGYKKNADGCYEKTITVGTALEDYTNVQLLCYFADENKTNVQCSYNNGFTVDDSGLNINKAGRYEIKYIYTGYTPEGQDPVTLSIFINVVE